MDEYNLTPAPDEEQQKAVRDQWEWNKSQRPILYLYNYVSNFCDVTFVIGSKRGRTVRVLNFFGLPQDVEMAQYLIKMLEGIHTRALAQYRRSSEYRAALNEGVPGLVLTNQFTIGFGRRINDRLKAIKEASRTEGTSLIVSKNALIKQRMAEEGLRIRTTNTSHQSHEGSRNRGGSVADRANLNRPINERTSGTRMLS